MESTGLMEGSSDSQVVEVLSELLVVVELLVLLIVDELSTLLVAVELLVLLIVDELSTLLVAVEFSVLPVTVELSVVLDKAESSALSVVEELSTVLVDELSGVSEFSVDEFSDKLVRDELSGVPIKLSASLEHAVRDIISARAVIIDKKRFIIAVPFVYFYLIIHYCPRKSNIKNKNTTENQE